MRSTVREVKPSGLVAKHLECPADIAP